MCKIPHELRLIVSRKVSCENFDFDEIMKVIEGEIDAREHVFVNLAGQDKKQTKELQLVLKWQIPLKMTIWM